MQRFRFIGIALTVLVIGVIVFALVLGVDTFLKRSPTNIPLSTLTSSPLDVTSTDPVAATLNASTQAVVPTLDNSIITNAFPTPNRTSGSEEILLVNSLADTSDGKCDAEHCTLREAIASAVAGDHILFAPNLAGIIQISGQIVISKDLSIEGNSSHSHNITIEGNTSTNFITISSGIKVSINHLSFINRKGMVFVNSDNSELLLNNSTFKDSQGTIVDNVHGTVHIAGSTFQDNTAGVAAAIHNHGGKVMVINSTLYNNQGTSRNAIRNESNGTITLINTTVYENDANSLDLIFENDKGDFTLKNTLIVSTNNERNCSGTFIDGGNNLQFPGTSCGTTIQVANPLLEPIQDNSGSTWTMAIASGSPAIDAVQNAACSETQNIDQRGKNRPSGKACDIGSFEYELAQ